MTLRQDSMIMNTATAPERRGRRMSLVTQASIEKFENEGAKRKNTVKRREQLGEGLLRGKHVLQKLNDAGVDLIFTSERNERIVFSVVVTAVGTISEIVSALTQAFTSAGITLEHLETRPTKEKIRNGPTERAWDVLTECEGTKEQLIAAASLLVDRLVLKHIDLFKSNAVVEIPWFPTHVSELDKCATCITKYEPTTDPRHPGHGDEAYIARRATLNAQALGYRHGDPVPYIDYTDEENRTWSEVFFARFEMKRPQVYAKLKTLHSSHTCETYRKNLAQLEDEGVFTMEKIPQLADVNKYLHRKTGFIMRPCSGLLSARDFLASLAFRVFQATQYVRHSGHPHHSPEPDVIHELLGHVPMFADPALAQLSQDIGLMSLGASDEHIEKLSTVYWFIVEFGLCREDGRLKAIGAGLISAYGELQHACSDVPEHRDFEPASTALQTYEDDDYQPLYFVADSIQGALLKLRQYALSMERPFTVSYDPFTRSVEVIRKVTDLEKSLARFKMDFSSISYSLEQLALATNINANKK